MIEFNLLPDVKLEYIKARRSKHSVMLIALTVAGAALAILIILFLTVNVFQRQHLNNLSKDIKRDSQKLEAIADLDKILTVQNQLNKLTELHNAKPVASRLKAYLPQVTPENVSYSEIEVNFEASTIKFAGNANSLKTINQFVDTLKFTKFTSEKQTEPQAAFNEVVLSTFSIDEASKGSYEINLKFDPMIFSSESEVVLIVPKIITTRSATERPDENLLQPDVNQQGDE